MSVIAPNPISAGLAPDRKILWIAVLLMLAVPVAAEEPESATTEAAPAESSALMQKDEPSQDAGLADIEAVDEPPSEQIATDEAPGVEPEVAASPSEVVSPQRLSWDERVDQFEIDDMNFAADRENPDELFIELTELLEMRTTQFELILSGARSRSDLADPQVEQLASAYPQMDANLYYLPDGVQTVQQAHENLLALYAERVRLFTYVSGDLRARVTGIEIFGTRELLYELRLIWLELRYQVLRVPDAGRLIVQMFSRAPLKLIEVLLQLIVLIFVFRWWRHWFPETLQRSRTYLMSIRPRTSEILGRMRGLWYIERVRRPVEWLVFFIFLIQILSFLNLEFVSDLARILVRWILVTWFVVALVDAVVSRGAGGAASDIGKARRTSLRWVAAWLVFLGLGLELAERLAGDLSLYAWVWRLFKLLAVPLVFSLLGIWREELYQRARLEDRDFMPRKQFEAQRGFGKYIDAAKLAGFLVTTWLRAQFLRRLERLDPSRAASVQTSDGVTAGEQKQPISPELRERFLTGSIAYSRYGRAERDRLLARIAEGIGGSILIVGERGIGKDMFMQQLVEEASVGYISLDFSEGTAISVQRQLTEALGISGPMDDREVIARAVEEKQVRLLLISNMHLMVRPVMNGLDEMLAVGHLFDMMPSYVLEVMGIDRYAWQYIKCALAERAGSTDVITLPAWTDEQIRGLIEARCEAAEIQPDYLHVRVPSQYLSSADGSTRERNRKGISTMVATLSGGNPSVAMRLFIDALYMDKRGELIAGLPANRVGRAVDQAPLHVLLVLRVIAQAEYITKTHIVENLRYPQAVVENGLRFALSQGWITQRNGLYTITWPWFFTVTRVLARQNLLAGVTEAEQ